MLSLTELAFLALLLPAGAALVGGVMGRPWPASAGVWARWVVRAGLLLALADVAALLNVIQPSGSAQVTLWHLETRLPVTLQLDVSGVAIAIAVLGAALVVSFAASDRRPLASAALGLAALGGVMVALSGGLFSLFVGLELSAVGGIGLSYARYPRLASTRIVWAAAADQAVALVWLGVMVIIYHQVGTLQFADIPTSAFSFWPAAILLVPAGVRLAGAVLVGAGGSDSPESEVTRALDVADWMAVVAVPTALVLILRVHQLAGGAWPGLAFGTVLDLVGLAFAAAGLGSWLLSPRGKSEVRTLLLGAGALIWLGFGANSAVGAELAIGAGIFMELAVAFLPRSLLGAHAPSPSSGGRVWVWVQTSGGVAATMLPISLGVTVAMVGLSAEIQGGMPGGIVPALGYVSALACLGLLVPRASGYLRAVETWNWVLALPSAGLLCAALMPGWVLNSIAAPVAFAGAGGVSPLVALDPFVVQLASLVWPVGYVTILMALAGVSYSALRYATGIPVWPNGHPGPAPEPQPGPARLAAARAFVAGRSRPARHVFNRLLRAGALAVELSERELAERPVWLWLSTTAVIGWLMSQR
ncbi:MAG: hypothetical protein ACYDEA_00560 [Candidatus Dormibacteria bacterium]